MSDDTRMSIQNTCDDCGATWLYYPGHQTRCPDCSPPPHWAEGVRRKQAEREDGRCDCACHQPGLRCWTCKCEMPPNPSKPAPDDGLRERIEAIVLREVNEVAGMPLAAVGHDTLDRLVALVREVEADAGQRGQIAGTKESNARYREELDRERARADRLTEQIEEITGKGPLAYIEEREAEAKQQRARADAAEKRVRELEAAVLWALGESGPFRLRRPGEGPFWWRTELRYRAARDDE